LARKARGFGKQADSQETCGNLGAL